MLHLDLYMTETPPIIRELISIFGKGEKAINNLHPRWMDKNMPMSHSLLKSLPEAMIYLPFESENYFVCFRKDE